MTAERMKFFAFQRVFDAADHVLNLALDLVGLALCLQLGVTDRLADGLLTLPLTTLADPMIRSLVDHFFLQQQSP